LTEDVEMEEPLEKHENKENTATERLEELDISVIAQPSIRNAKKKSKEEKIIEVMEGTSSERNNTNKDKTVLLPSNQKQENNQEIVKEGNVNKTNKKEKHITMIENEQRYDIASDLNKVSPNINFSQLLDLSPKLRSQLARALKLKNFDTNDDEKLVLSTISREDIATCKCSINGMEGFAFIDTCASINIVTKKFLEKLGKLKPFGYTTNDIIQITTRANISSELYLLKIQIGRLIFQDVFRVIDCEQELFDILIGYRTIKDNNLFINPINNYICKMENNENFTKLIPLSSNEENSDATIKIEDNEIKVNNHSLLFCFINKKNMENNKKDSEASSNTKTISTLIEEKEKIIKDILDEVPELIKHEFQKLLDSYKEILAISLEELSTTKLMPHNIQLIEGAQPIKQKSYRLSKNQADALKGEVVKLINHHLIEPSSSPWSSPVILVPKKNNKWRMCVDYRKLNNVTIKDAYSLPLIDDILTSICGKVRIFTTIDLFSGFYQIPMDAADIPKTSFTTMYGNYQFKVMPFGLCNAPGTFQREMNRIFLPLIGKCMFIYIDDLIIFSSSLNTHITDLQRVFEIIKENGLKINLEKCNFFKESVELLGHTVTIEGISPIPEKTKVIVEWLPPTNVKQLQSFLGSVGYYRKFIANFASLAKPLFILLKKGNEFLWGNEQQESFEELKKRLITAPILVMPDYNKQFLIRTDASKDGVGGVLIQKDDLGNEKPIHFISRTLKPAENNYGITDLEGTAAAYCVKKFKSYISGSKFETLLYTDHKPLISLFKNKETVNARQTRWVLLLSMLKVRVIYEPGRKNVVADALSRMKTKKEGIVATTIETGRNVGTTLENPLITKMKDKFIILDNEEYFVDNGSFRKVIKDEKQKINLILEAHNVGHEGIFKTYNRLKRDYYWTNMVADVRYIVATCHKCQIFKPQKFTGQTENIPTEPGLPFTKVGLDIIGPLPRTKKGNQYIIVLVDYLTKWVEAEPTSSIESDDVISFLIRVFSRHGIPEIIVTDNGPQFSSDKTKAFLDLYGTYVQFVSVYHPESNGMVENRNKEIGKYLKILCDNKALIWDEILPSALWALRTCKNETTKFSSFELLYGRRDLQPFELTVNLDKKEPFETQEEYMIRKFTKHHTWILEAINNIQTANKIWADRRNQMKRMQANYQPGDLVLVRTINRRKLDPYFIGPLKIVKKQFNTLTLCDPITNEIANRNVHLKNVIPYKLCEIRTSGTKSD